MGETSKKYAGFTLLELLVAITSSTIILGGFLIAFSSLSKTSRLRDRELQSLREGAAARMKIEKALTGASLAAFNTIASNSTGSDVPMLYYYKFNDDPEAKLIEYGYFYVDEQQQSIDPSYQERLDDSGTPLKMDNLYFNRILVSESDPEYNPGKDDANFPKAEDFKLREPDREVVVHEVSDFFVRVDTTDTNDSKDKIYRADKRVSYSLDYQISSNFFLDTSSDSTANRRERIFKGSSYVLGKVTS